MAHHLSIDIETFSSVDIRKSGLFKYIESPDFQILLFAYSLNGEPVQIVDLARGENIPSLLIGAISSPEYIKHAYNAAFEWASLSKFLGFLLPVNQWRCTMAHGLYCGYPAGLDSIGKALKLDSSAQKLNTGKALIRYFCVPCKPTKTNGGRIRNLPHHDTAKWNLFKDYCCQDVVTEASVKNRLSSFPMPDFIQKEWETDLKINSRGVAVDMSLVTSAISIGNDSREELVSEAINLTGLNNPNSVAQLSSWLSGEIGESVSGVTKETVSQLLQREGNSDEVQRMLEIRKELGKTSTKKYDAIVSAVCSDGRVRGLLQFYGANRTGRWAGRLVQVQNLPRTYLEPLQFARDLAIEKQKDSISIVYGSVFDTLSQLIRTSFISTEGKILLDADFSAIEARVISWLADEQWRLDVFRTHGKIYEASASQMFGVPLGRISKGNPEYELRQKGKVAELALGYQGGTGALIQMGALNMGLSEEELPEIVSRWRSANKRIRDLWYSVEKAATIAISDGRVTGVGDLVFSREYDHHSGLDFLTVLLPSKRKLFYASPSLGLNRWGNPSISYMGMEQATKRWGLIETYGGKLVENITQAVARDCLACAIERLESAGFPVVFHVHDEVVIEIEESKADLDSVIKLLSEPMPWAESLPLGADGWVGKFFRKD